MPSCQTEHLNTTPPENRSLAGLAGAAGASSPRWNLQRCQQSLKAALGTADFREGTWCTAPERDGQREEGNGKRNRMKRKCHVNLQE